MSCCDASPRHEEIDEASRLVAARLSAVLNTLREAGFAAGLQEGRDAAALMAAGYAERPALLRVALKHLFSARKSDWDRFDGLFDAFWLGKRARSRSLTSGSARAANNPSLMNLQDSRSQPIGLPMTKPARIAPAKGARKAPRAPKTLPKSISARWPIPSRSNRRMKPQH